MESSSTAIPISADCPIPLNTTCEINHLHRGSAAELAAVAEPYLITLTERHLLPAIRDAKLCWDSHQCGGCRHPRPLDPLNAIYDISRGARLESYGDGLLEGIIWPLIFDYKPNMTAQFMTVCLMI